MSCQCQEICRVINDIAKINEGKTILGGFRVKKSCVETWLRLTANTAENTTELEKVAGYRDQTLTLSDDMDSVKNSIASEMDEKKSELESELADLRKEDKEFHEKRRRG